MKILKILFVIMIASSFISCAGMMKPTKTQTQKVVIEDAKVLVATPTITVTATTKTAKKAITEMTGRWGPPELRSQLFPFTFVDGNGNMKTILVETERYYFHSSDTHYTVVVVYNDQIIYKEAIEKIIIYKNK